MAPAAGALLPICPACGAVLEPAETTIVCEGCGRSFQVVAEIPDLRLGYADPYLSWEEDVARARELADELDEVGFATLLEQHWLRSGTPAKLAEHFITRELHSGSTSESYVEAIERMRGRALDSTDSFLEVGCGAAGLAAVAAGRAGTVYAMDVSMRWLVLAKKRLTEAGIGNVELVCFDAEHPVLPPGSFDVVAAGDVIEHADDQRQFVAGCAKLLKPGGMLFLATPNRFSLGLEPHVRLWGVGWLPLPLANAYVRLVRRRPYEHVRLLSARSLRRLLTAQGFRVGIVPPEIPPGTQRAYKGIELALVRLYNKVRRFRLVRRVLLAVGPFFHVFATKEGHVSRAG
jgi:2-polyprenyl-3-methyl-5-hydroxy-6-metoxy-1,4-benzoquinol methylase